MGGGAALDSEETSGTVRDSPHISHTFKIIKTTQHFKTGASIFRLTNVHVPHVHDRAALDGTAE